MSDSLNQSVTDSLLTRAQASADRNKGTREQGTGNKPVNSPIHPTQRSSTRGLTELETDTAAPSTHVRATMDGSTNVEHWNDQPRCARRRCSHPQSWHEHFHGVCDEDTCPCPGFMDPAAHHDNTTEPVTDVRPVRSVVARKLGQVDVVIGDWQRGESPRDPFVDLGVLVAEVRRLREREAALIRAKDVDLDDVRDELAEAHVRVNDLMVQRSADGKTIGVLSAAVAKVNALHQPDADDFCRSCRTEAWPCDTAKAIGVGQ